MTFGVDLEGGRAWWMFWRLPAVNLRVFGGHPNGVLWWLSESVQCFKTKTAKGAEPCVKQGVIDRVDQGFGFFAYARSRVLQLHVHPSTSTVSLHPG